MTIQPLTYAHLHSLRRMAESVRLPRVVDLGMGRHRTQGYFNTCAAHTILNVAESCADADINQRHLWPDVSALEVYELARQLDKYNDWGPGTDIFSAARAYCQIAGTGVKPMEVPSNLAETGTMAIHEFMAMWLAFQQTAIAIGIHWTKNDQFPGRSRVMAPSMAYIGNHAISVHGYDQAHRWSNYSFLGIPIGKRQQAPVFAIENSNNTHPELEFYLPMARLKKDLISAVVLVPPSFQ